MTPLPRATGTNPGPVTPAAWNAVIDHIAALEARILALTPSSGPDIGFRQNKAGFTAFLKRRVAPRPGLTPPFWPSLVVDNSGETPAYYVTVSPGYVCERDLTLGEDVDALIYHDCPSRLDGEDLHQFPIANGESIFVLVREKSTGAIGATAPDEPVDLVVASSTTKSLNFIPSTQAGLYYYELASLTVTEDVPTLAIIMGGSHIYHTSGLTCDFRLLTCTPDTEPYLPAQVLRFSAVSGVICSIGESVSSRPLSAQVEECHVETCT
jgi:hypothetical protein